MKTGEFTEPILTRQGYIILKVVQHIPAARVPYKEVETQVEDAFYMSRMEPAIRDYLTKMREDAFIDIKPGYIDTGASPNETKPVFSAYTPPAPKKKAKVERTRFRETTHTFRQKSPQARRQRRRRPSVKVNAVKKSKHAKNPSLQSRSRARRKKFAMAKSRAKRFPPRPTAPSRMPALFLRRPRLLLSRSIRSSPLPLSKRPASAPVPRRPGRPSQQSAV